MSGRIQARLPDEELQKFDELPEKDRIVVYRNLGSENFQLFYGVERRMAIQNIPGVVQGTKMKYPDGNPKTQFGIAKPDQWAVDPIAVYEMGLVMMQGMLKYGLFNYYEDPISISTYVNAARRHLDLYELGQDFDSDTNALHAAHMMACGSILVSSHYRKRLIDDRTPFKEMADGLEEYFKVNQDRVKAIREQWTGFAEAQLAKKDQRSGDPIEISGSHSPIPADIYDYVYYKDDNFYDRETSVGKGLTFYNKWIARKNEFRQNR